MNPRPLAFLVLLSLPFLARAAEEAVDPLLWNATASNSSSLAQQACDGDMASRWDTGGKQAAGQWFQVDLGQSRPVSRIEMDATGSNNDYPRRYELSVSDDGQQWQSAAKGDGAVVTKIALRPARACRYLRVTIPEGSPLAGGFWSIHEFRVFGDSAGAAELPRPPVHWHVVTPSFPTRDVVMAGYEITDFGIDPAKGQDATQAIRLATRLLARAGGGTLWLPAGHYRLSEPISLTGNVTLRGDWAAPEPGKPVRGTVLELTANRGDAEGTPAISLSGAAAVDGVAFWYPDQKAAAIAPYPVAVKQFGGTGMALENVTFVNAYRGFACGPDICALYFLRNVYGTVLDTGIKVDGTADIGRMEHVRFGPAFWSDSGLPDAPAAGGPQAAWMKDHGVGILMRRNDWSYAYDVQLDGYHYGFQTLPALDPEDVEKNRKNYANGNNAKFRFLHCHTAIQCEGVSDAGLMFHDCDIVDCEEGIEAQAEFNTTIQVQDCRIEASQAAVRLLGSGQILLVGCTVNGAVQNETGYVSLAGCTPEVPAKTGSAPGVGEIRLLPAPALPKLADPYATPADRFAPPSDRLAVVTDPAFGAKGDAAADDTAAVKSAIASLGSGGGTVYFPPGEYRVTSELSVPTGVELRGVSEDPHQPQTRGSILDVVPGKGQEDGTPFITLAAKSGLRGLVFHYPDQDSTNVSAYPWTIRGAGEGVWLINLSCTFAYRFVDLDTVRCDHHYVDYVAGHAFREAFRIGGGAVGGRVLNCQLNPSAYSFTNVYANSPNRIDPRNERHVGDATDQYAKAHEDAFVIRDCTDEILFQNFVFGALHGLTFSGTTGPSGWCLGHGSDQSRWGIWIEKIGPGGMPLVNTQLVTVDSFGGERGYIGLAPGFTGTAAFLGVDAWGGPSTAIGVNGGHLDLASAVISRSGAATVTLKGSGSVALSSAVLRNPDVVVQRDRIGDNVQLSGVVIPGKPFLVANAPADLPEGLDSVQVEGTEIGVPFDAAAALPVAGWKMHPSANPGEAAKAVDGDPASRWTTARGTKKGDEVVVEMDQPHTLSKVRFETLASRNDYPRRFKLYLSADGKEWGEPVATGRGEADLRIGFKPREVRFIRLVNLAEGGGFWSIHEIQAE